MPARLLRKQVALRAWGVQVMPGVQLSQVHPAWLTSLAVTTALPTPAAPIHPAAGAQASLVGPRPQVRLARRTALVLLRGSAGHKLRFKLRAGASKLGRPHIVFDGADRHLGRGGSTSFCCSASEVRQDWFDRGIYVLSTGANCSIS